MPTNLEFRQRKKLDFFIVFVISLAIAAFAIEIIDPAPMETAASVLSLL
jgi:hypothetical protein